MNLKPNLKKKNYLQLKNSQKFHLDIKEKYKINLGIKSITEIQEGKLKFIIGEKTKLKERKVTEIIN